MADYFSYNRRRGQPNAQDRQNAPGTPAPQTPGAGGGGSRRPPPGAGSLENLRAPSSIRIRRLPNAVPGTPRPATQQGEPTTPQPDSSVSGRRRSSSEPQHYGANLAPPGQDLARQRTTEDRHMPTINEARTPGHPVRHGSDQFFEARETPGAGPATPSINIDGNGSQANRVVNGAATMQDAGNAARSNRGLGRLRTTSYLRNEQPEADEYSSDVVDLLDLVDPEVRTINTFTNVQNSLFVPDLGSWINRRPTYEISRRPTGQAAADRVAGNRVRAGTGASRPPVDLPTIPQTPEPQETSEQQPPPGEKPGDIELQPSRTRRFSISSDLSDSRYAVLPHGISLEGWSEDDKAELDDHVRHLLHSRKEGFKRSWKGFKKYVSKPLGLFVFTYATLVTLFGAGWVFFLIGWIYVGQRQQYIINIIDNLLVALFALIGDGLAPFRAIDTYHMCFIARYHHMTWRLRKEKNLPELVDHNDLPDRRVDGADLEDAIDKEETAEFSVLKPIQQKRLQYHQAKFSKQHTFYRPHETSTHHAFPLNLLVVIVTLLDCHSLLQVALGTTTWSWNYKTRPESVTSAILACSLSCNITAGIIISVGDHRTRKKDVLERIFRQELTEEAMGRMAEERQSQDLVRKATEASQAVKEQAKGRHSMDAQRSQNIDKSNAEAGASMPAIIEHTPSNKEKKIA